MKNLYCKRSRLSPRKFREIVRCFALDLTATKTAALTGVSVRSVNDIFLELRRRIACLCVQEAPVKGTVEIDESYFGPRWVRGKRGRGAGGKTIVFGIFKRHGQVITEIVPDCRKKTLQQVIRGRVSVQSVIHSDGWGGYDGLVDLGYAKHFRVNHAADEFAHGSNHINGIESFWAYAKHRLAQFKGVPHHTFYLHLKETEFRFNHRRDNLNRILLRCLRNNPLSAS